jgi:hypothetical protein
MVDHSDVNLKAEQEIWNQSGAREKSEQQCVSVVCAEVQPACVALDLSMYELGGGLL